MRLTLLMLTPVLLCHGQFVPEDLIADGPLTRQIAQWQLAGLPDGQRAVETPELVRLLRESGPRQGSRVVPAFAKLGAAAVPVLLRLSYDPKPRMRAFAAEALAMIRPIAPDTLKELNRLLNDPEPWVRARVEESLLSLGLEDAEMQKALSDDWRRPLTPLQPDDRSADPRNLPALLEDLKSHDPDVQADAAETLVRMHLYRPEIEMASIRALRGPSERVRAAARAVLQYWFTEESQDALLDDEVAGELRKWGARKQAQIERLRAYTLAEITAAIPEDADRKYPLDILDRLETKSPDGTAVFSVVHTGRERGDLLRIWKAIGSHYFLLVKYEGIYGEHLSTGSFHYRGKVYLHVRKMEEGTGYFHSDDFYRVEWGALTKLTMPKKLPVELELGEGVWKGAIESFKDDDLTFEFDIWKNGDANCCPSVGKVTGTYTIEGDELKYATWKVTRFPPANRK